MKWTAYRVLKAIILVIYGMVMGPWSLAAIDPIAIAFRVIVTVGFIGLTYLIYTWLEEGLEIRKKLE